MSRLKRYKSRDGHAENRGPLLSYGWARHLGIGHSGRKIGESYADHGTWNF